MGEGRSLSWAEPEEGERKGRSLSWAEPGQGGRKMFPQVFV